MFLTRAISLLCLLFPMASSAQDLPKFDGVYLGLKDGSFEKLSPFVGQQLIIKDFGNDGVGTVPQDFIPVVYSNVAFQAEILSATFFDSDNVESIFIRSRTIRLLSVVTVMKVEDLRIAGDLSKSDLARRAAAAVRLKSEYPAIGATECGISADSMNLLNETETTYQYFFEGSEPDILDVNGQDIKGFQQTGQTCRFSVKPSIGLMLVTSAGSFILLEADAMRDEYVPGASVRWQTYGGGISQLTTKIEAADR